MKRYHQKLTLLYSLLVTISDSLTSEAKGGLKNMHLLKNNSTKITDKNSDSLKKEMNWEGKGSKNDPIIIEHLRDLPPILKFYKGRIHYHIKNLTIDKLTCHKTQNITIENNVIKYLKMEECFNLNLVNNKILKHKVAFTKGCAFIDNKIYNFEEFIKNQSTSLINPLSRQLMTPLGCCLYFLIISSVLSWAYTWIIGLCLIGLLFYLNLSRYAKDRRIKEKPENSFVNNVEI